MRGPARSASAARKPARGGEKRAKAPSKRAGRGGASSGEPLKIHAGKAPQRGETVLELSVTSDLNLKYAYMLRIVGAVLTRLSLGEEEEGRLQACLDEGLQNAIVWGCGGDPQKTVAVRAWVEDGAWGLTITDPGKGFTPAALPDYESEEFPLLEKGRGIFRLLHLAGEVSYYDGGRTLLLKGSPAAAEVAAPGAV